LVHPGRVICLMTVTTVFRCRVSGFRCQRGAKLIIGYCFWNLRVRIDVIMSLILAQPLAFGAAD